MANSAAVLVNNAIKGLVPNGDGTFRCFPNVAPALVARPYITYQAIPGKSANYLNNTVSAQQNVRMQVNVWADDQGSADSLMQSVINALTPPPVNATSIGSPGGEYEFDTKLYGSRLDFSIWFTP